jgi:hypothetical protein
MRLIFFVRIFDFTNYLFRVFYQSLRSIGPFLTFFIVILLGFIDAIYKLGIVCKPYDAILGYVPVGGVEDEETGEKTFGARPVEDYPDAIILTYKAALGDFGDIYSAYTEKTYDPNVMPYFMFFINLITLFFMIALLNVLIAIVGQTYDEVMELREQNTLLEKATVISDIFALRSRSSKPAVLR